MRRASLLHSATLRSRYGGSFAGNAAPAEAATRAACSDPSVSRPFPSLLLLHVDAPAAGGDSRGEARGSGGSLVAGAARA
jgi:hypothetical protein